METQDKLRSAISSFLDRFQPTSEEDRAILRDIQTALALGESLESQYSRFAVIGDETLLIAIYHGIPNLSRGGVRQAILDNPRCPSPIYEEITGPKFNTPQEITHPLLTLNDTIELDLQGLADYEAMIPDGEITGPDRAGCEGRIRNLQNLFDRLPRILHETDFTNNSDPMFPDLIAARQRIAFNQNYFTRLCIAITNRFQSMDREPERDREHTMEETQTEPSQIHSEPEPEADPIQEPNDSTHVSFQTNVQAPAAKKAAERQRQQRLRREGAALEDRTHREQVQIYEQAAHEATGLSDANYTEGQAQYLKRQAELRDDEMLHQMERDQAEMRERQREDLRRYEERMERSRSYESFGMEHIDLSGAGRHGNSEVYPNVPREESHPIPPHPEVESPSRARSQTSDRLFSRTPEERPHIQTNEVANDTQTTTELCSTFRPDTDEFEIPNQKEAPSQRQHSFEPVDRTPTPIAQPIPHIEDTNIPASEYTDRSTPISHPGVDQGSSHEPQVDSTERTREHGTQRQDYGQFHVDPRTEVPIQSESSDTYDTPPSRPTHAEDRNVPNHSEHTSDTPHDVQHAAGKRALRTEPYHTMPEEQRASMEHPHSPPPERTTYSPHSTAPKEPDAGHTTPPSTTQPIESSQRERASRVYREFHPSSQNDHVQDTTESHAQSTSSYGRDHRTAEHSKAQISAAKEDPSPFKSEPDIPFQPCSYAPGGCVISAHNPLSEPCNDQTAHPPEVEHGTLSDHGTISTQDVHLLRANLDLAQNEYVAAKGNAHEKDAERNYKEARAALLHAANALKDQSIHCDSGAVPATDVHNVSRLRRTEGQDTFSALQYTPNGVKGNTFHGSSTSGTVAVYNQPGTADKLVLSKDRPLLVTQEYENALNRSAEYARAQLRTQTNKSEPGSFSPADLAKYKMCLDAYAGFCHAKQEGYVRISATNSALTTPDQRAWAARQETYRNTRNAWKSEMKPSQSTAKITQDDAPHPNTRKDPTKASNDPQPDNSQRDSGRNHIPDDPEPNNNHRNDDRNNTPDDPEPNNNHRNDDRNNTPDDPEPDNNHRNDDRNNTPDDPEPDNNNRRSWRCPKCGHYLLGPVCFNCIRQDRNEETPKPKPEEEIQPRTRAHAPFGSYFSVRYNRGRYTAGEKESSADLFGRSTKLKRISNLKQHATRMYGSIRMYAPEAAIYAANKFYNMAQADSDTSSQSIRTFEQMRYYGTVGTGLVLAVTQRKIGDVEKFTKHTARQERHNFGFTRDLSDREITRKLHSKVNQGQSAKREIRQLYERQASLTPAERETLAQKISAHKETIKETKQLAGLQQARIKEKLQREVLEELHRKPNGQGMVTEKSIRDLENHRKQVQQERIAIRKTQTERGELNKRISELQRKGRCQLSEAEQAELNALRKKLSKLDSDPRLKALDRQEQELLKRIKGHHDDTTVPLKNIRLKDVERVRKDILAEYDKLERLEFREFIGIKSSSIKKNKALLERQSERAKQHIGILSKKTRLTADEKVQLKNLNKILERNKSKIKAHADVLKARNIRDSKLEILDKVRKQLLKKKRRLRMTKMALITFMMKPLQEGDQSGAQGLAKGISFGMNPYVREIIKKSWRFVYRSSARLVKTIGAKTGLDKVAAPVVNKAREVKKAAQKIINTPKELEKQLKQRSKEAIKRTVDRLTPQYIKTGRSFVRKQLTSAAKRLQKTKLGKAYETMVRTLSKIKAIAGAVGKAVSAVLIKVLLALLLFLLIIALISVFITSVGTSVPSTIIMSTETTEDGKVDLTPYAEIYNAKLDAFQEDIVAAKTRRHYDNITEICYGAANYNNIKEVLSMMAVRMNQDLDMNTKPEIKRYIRSLFDDSHIIDAVESDPYSCEGCMYRYVVLPHTDDCEDDCTEVHIGTELYCPGNHMDLTLKITTLSFDEIFTADSMGNAEQEVQAGGLIGDDFQITFYLPTGNKTASGTVPKAGHTIAVDPSVIPLGTHVIINGHEYVAEDTGGAINGHIIDIFVDSAEDIPSAGRLHNVSVFLADYVGEGVQTSGEWNGWVEENRLFAKNLYNAPWDDLYGGVDAIGTYVGNMVDYDWDSFQYSDESNLTQAQQRVSYIAKNSNLFGIPANAGYCQQWVRLVYSEAGYSTGSAASANDAADQWLVSSDWTGIPVGAAVYGYSSSIYGHVGIYVGDGKVYHNVGGVAIDDLQSWVTKYRGYGWGWQGGHDLTLGN